MDFETIKDIDVRGKRILLRADLNVPAQRGKVTDTTRIDRLKPTIDYLREAGAKVLILSHFGRPEGEQNPEMSLAFLVSALEECWGCDVKFATDCIGERAAAVANALGDGDVALLENLRFHKGEKENDPAFVAELAKLGDIYVNDAFSAAHRAHASTEGLAHVLPPVAGLSMARELKALDAALDNPKTPVVAVTGGSKISTKLSVLYHLVEKVDYLILGGAMANTFIYAQGGDIGASMCEKDMQDEAKKILAHAKDKRCKILLPIDATVVRELKNGAEHSHVPADKIPSDMMAIDAGPKSIEYFLDEIKDCKTLVWNGPLGVFEISPFDAGTNALAKAVAQRTKDGSLISIAGGGDTVAALENAGVACDLSYMSTAGGAFLEWLQGKPLPGVAALSHKKKAA
ncbi:MAG: phosphoglycerate kinase [Alphaproteobacteria bacterium]|nr:phosphoglycerate kinase [Alphaproteobacteria bacterium]